MPPDQQKTALRAVIEQLAIIGGVTAIIGVICALLDLPPQRNAAVTAAFFLFLVILWWRQQVNRIPSSVILALIIPATLLSLYLIEGDACLKLAKRAGKPYDIKNITYFVRLEPDSDPRYVIESHRIVYSLRATRDIKPSEETFEEEIHSDHAQAVGIRWSGTEEEKLHTQNSPGHFQVLFPMKTGENRTIVTGVNFRIP